MAVMEALGYLHLLIWEHLPFCSWVWYFGKMGQVEGGCPQGKLDLVEEHILEGVPQLFSDHTPTNRHPWQALVRMHHWSLRW